MISVTCAIIEKGSKILIARRAADQKLARKWEIPGGKVDDRESPEECLRRELAEEFGIQTKVGEFITSNVHHYDHMSIELLAFHTTFVSGSFTPVDHDRIKWVKPEELLDYNLAEADIPIAKMVSSLA